MIGESKPTARIDLTKVSVVTDVDLGDIVTLTIKGKVRMMRGPEEGLRESYSSDSKKQGKKEKYSYPGCLEIEIDSVKVDGHNDFSGMEDD